MSGSQSSCAVKWRWLALAVGTALTPGCITAQPRARDLSSQREVATMGMADAHESLRRLTVRIEYPDGRSVSFAAPHVKPIEVSDADFQSAMVDLLAALPMELDSGLAAADRFQRTSGGGTEARFALWRPEQSAIEGYGLLGNKRLFFASTETPGIPSVSSVYYRLCERMGTSGDCLGILGKKNAVLLDRFFYALHFALLPTLQAAFQTITNVTLEQLESTILIAIATYLLLWIAPEPFSKVVALIASAGMVAYVGYESFHALRDAAKVLKKDLEEATNQGQVRTAGEWFGMRVGPSFGRVLVMVGMWALGAAVAKLPPPSLPGMELAAANAGAQGLTLNIATLEGASMTLGARSLTVTMASTFVGGLVAAAGMKGGDNGQAPSQDRAPSLSAGKNFKEHFIAKRPLLEKALGNRFGKLKEGGGDEFLKALADAIENGTFKYIGRGTLKKGMEAMNIYRGLGLTVVTKMNGEWVTLLESGQGLDLAIQMLP
jgi:hypothetical protein